MKTTTYTVAALFLFATTMNGCVTKDGGGEQIMGAGGGAVLGGLVGQMIGHDTKSTLIGTAIGAALGWGAVKLMQYNSQEVRSASSDQQLYGFSETVDNPRVVIRRGTTNPKEARAGEQLQIMTDYSLVLPKNVNQAEVTESLALKKNGEKLADIPSKTISHKAGGILSEASINLPKGADAGTYVIEHKVQSGTSYDVDESVFVVKK